jgi:predicted DNA-binding transcriptional regulator AlpA
MVDSSEDGPKADHGPNGDGLNLSAGEIARPQPRLSPLLLRASDAAAACHTSVRTWRSWNSSGRIPRPICIGRSIFWRPEELKAWVAAGCPDRATWEVIRETRRAGKP